MTKKEAQLVRPKEGVSHYSIPVLPSMTKKKSHNMRLLKSRSMNSHHPLVVNRKIKTLICLPISKSCQRKEKERRTKKNYQRILTLRVLKLQSSIS